MRKINDRTSIKAFFAESKSGIERKRSLLRLEKSSSSIEVDNKEMKDVDKKISKKCFNKKAKLNEHLKSDFNSNANNGVEKIIDIGVLNELPPEIREQVISDFESHGYKFCLQDDTHSVSDIFTFNVDGKLHSSHNKHGESGDQDVSPVYQSNSLKIGCETISKEADQNKQDEKNISETLITSFSQVVFIISKFAKSEIRFD